MAKSAVAAAFQPQLRPTTNVGRPCSTYADCLAKLNAGEDIDYDGASGRLQLDEVGDPGSGRFTIAGFVKGVFTEQSSTDIDLSTQRQLEAVAAAVFTSRLQQAMTLLGFYSGPIDGIYDDDVVAALKETQAALGVPVTGVYDPATDAALRARLGAGSSLLTDSTKQLQQLLTTYGFYTGPIDGVYSAATVAGVKALQAALGVPPTGVVDAATLQAAYDKGIASVVTSTTTPPASTTAPASSTTAAPTTTTTVALPNVVALMAARPELATFVSLLTLAGFDDDLSQPGTSYTVFAPDEAAFTAAGGTPFVDGLKKDPAVLSAFLALHVVAASIPTSALANGTLVSVNGAALTVAGVRPVITVNGAALVGAEGVGANGYVHVVDHVLQVVIPK